MTKHRLSVILATVNRDSILSKTLQSFLEMDLSGVPTEFIVIDNGSTDETQSVIDGFIGRLPLVSLFVETPGKNNCLNAALKVASGEYLVFTDDDVLADPKWLQEYDAIVKRWPDDIFFGGQMTPQFPDDTPDWMKDLGPYMTVLFGEYRPPYPEGPVEKIPLGGNMMVRKDVFEKYRYDESIGPAGKNYAMGSESEFLERVRIATKSRYIYAPDAKVQHMIREDQINEEWILARAYRSGRGMARNIRTHRWKIAGVPWPVWLRSARANAAAQFSQSQPLSKTFETRWMQQKLQGCIFEFRQQAKNAASTASTSA